MKHLKIYENYQTEEEVAKICQKYGITNWSINKDGLVDVNGNVYLGFKGLTELPIKFGIVSGHFYCFNNNLTTLKGAPQSVGGDFYCGYNKLTTIEGAPYSVSGDFDCNNNPLPDLIKNNMKSIKHIIANQEMYHIYNKDGTINKYRFGLMMDSMD